MLDTGKIPETASVNETFSVLFTQKADKFSLVFRPDSRASFADLDHYWDGVVFSTFHPQNQALTLFPPGSKLDFPYSHLRFLLDYGHFSVRYHLTAPERSSVPPVVASDTPTELVVELPPAGRRGLGRISFRKIEEKLVLEELHLRTPTGALDLHYVNRFSRHPATLIELPQAYVSSLSINGEREPGRHIAQLRHYQWIGDAESFTDDVFSPKPAGVVHVTDQRLPDKRIAYISDQGAVSMETLQTFAKDPAALQKHEDEVNARSLRP